MAVEQDLAPGLLLAAPSLGDPNFEKTVVLLGHHDGKGAMGWVINGDPLPPVRQLLQQSGLLPADAAMNNRPAFARPARTGGPVSPAMGWLIYPRLGDPLPGEMGVGPQIAVSGDRDALAAAIRGDGPRDFRMVLGYAGWSAGQLEREIREGSWLPAAVDLGLLFELEPDQIWEAAYQRSVGAAPGMFTSSSARRGQA